LSFVRRLEKIEELQHLRPVVHQHQKAGLWVIGTGGYDPK
jgi:hypothetical protein